MATVVTSSISEIVVADGISVDCSPVPISIFSLDFSVVVRASVVSEFVEEVESESRAPPVASLVTIEVANNSSGVIPSSFVTVVSVVS